MNSATVWIRVLRRYQAHCFGHAHSLVACSLPFSRCSVPPDPSACVYTIGFWANHPELWPMTSLTLGKVTYTQAQLLAIMAQPVGGNGLVSLAQQLIAAKLNYAANPLNACYYATKAINEADALIGRLVIPPIGSGYLSPSSVSSLVATLTAYNQGKCLPTASLFSFSLRRTNPAGVGLLQIASPLTHSGSRAHVCFRSLSPLTHSQAICIAAPATVARHRRPQARHLALAHERPPPPLPAQPPPPSRARPQAR